MKPPYPPEQRFWPKVDKRGPNECWEWRGSFYPDGYGQFYMHPRRNVRAHRVSYEVFVGPIDAGLFVCHSCDNPKCVNPAHLWLGTNSDNLKDCVRKGRAKKTGVSGEAHPHAKLTWPKVREIRAKRGTKPHHELAAEYGVTTRCIRGVIYRDTWRDDPLVQSVHLDEDGDVVLGDE